MMIYWIGLIAVAVMFALQFLTKSMENGLLTRLISGVILVILALLTIGLGGDVLFVTTLLLSIIAMTELFRALGIRTDTRPQLLEISGYIGVGLYYLCLRFLPAEVSWIGILVTLILLLTIYVARFPAIDISQIMTVFFAIVYTGVMLSCIYLLRGMDTGRLHVWLIFFAAWGSDTCAYCVGMLWGKHKMSPVLSPKKTLEGLAGGLIGAAVLGAVYALITGGPVVAYFLIALIGAGISVIGDLAASAIKRQRDIKDYGDLIPGHGGILDRFDSVIFTAPFVYLLCRILI